MWRCFIAIVLPLPFSVLLTSAATDADIVQKRLKVSNTFVTSIPASSLALPIKCDLNDNLYARISETGEIGSGSVVKFSADGQSVTRFTLAGNVKDAKDPKIRG